MQPIYLYKPHNRNRICGQIFALPNEIQLVIAAICKRLTNSTANSANQIFKPDNEHIIDVVMRILHIYIFHTYILLCIFTVNEGL